MLQSNRRVNPIPPSIYIATTLALISFFFFAKPWEELMKPGTHQAPYQGHFVIYIGKTFRKALL